MWKVIAFNWKLAAAAFSATILTRLLLWVVPFRWIGRFSNLQRATPARTNDLGRRHRVATAVRMVSRCVPGASCLTQALATQLILRLKGDVLPLQLGVAWSKGGNFEAHAWLESEGKVLIGDLPNLCRYKKLGGALLTA